MYGFPLTIYLLAGPLGSRFPFLRADHARGHLWNDLIGWKADPHLSPFHVLSYALIGGGFSLIATAWRYLYAAARAHQLAVDGPYARIRHPQYVGFLMVMTGLLVQWPTIPTLVMFPVLVVVYRRLARSEETEVASTFGQAWRDYAAHTPGFLPRRHQVGWASARRGDSSNPKHGARRWQPRCRSSIEEADMNAITRGASTATPVAARRDAGEVLVAAGIEKSYRTGVWPLRRGRPVLRGADLSLGAGEVVGLAGETGSGKSTLMKILVGSLPADSGTVTKRGRLGYCPQEPVVCERLTCDEHFEAGRPGMSDDTRCGARGRATICTPRWDSSDMHTRAPASWPAEPSRN